MGTCNGSKSFLKYTFVLLYYRQLKTKTSSYSSKIIIFLVHMVINHEIKIIDFNDFVEGG